MSDIQSLPLSELKADLAESLIDLRLARIALRMGIDRTPRGSVPLDRLQANARIIRVILDEIERRIVAGQIGPGPGGLYTEWWRIRP